MKKEGKRRIGKKVRVIIVLVAIAVIVIAVVLAYQARAARAELERSQARQTITLEKTDITRTISVSGVVESAQVRNIYSRQSFPVMEIYVKVGDSVRVGDLLAELDMSRIETDFAQAEINLESAKKSEEEEARSNRNSIINAQTTLESSQIALARQQLNTKNIESDLQEAEERMSEEFDSYTFDNMIADTRLALERRTEDLEDAQEDLYDAIHNFDDYVYQNMIFDAKINLERRKADYEDADRTHSRETRNTSVTLESQQNAVNEAEAARKIKQEAHAAMEKVYNDAKAHYDSIKSDEEVSDEEKEAALAAVESADEARKAAKGELDSAESALSRARSLLQIARDNALAPSLRAVNNAENALIDAQRIYDKALTDLQRAKGDAIDLASNKLASAEKACADAQRAYEKAMEDKIRAIDNNADNNESMLKNTQRAYDDSLRQLESSHNSVRTAQNTLNQAESRPLSQGSAVELQELNLDRLGDQLEEGKIYATADGVITEVNVKVGSTPNGVIFVIEDTNDLHVSVRVKEHAISDVYIGQNAVITTDATGDKEYSGKVSYISPRAVSAAGSTSVEFEVQAELSGSDTAIRIGMNAFLDIVIEQKNNVFAVPNSVIVTNEKGSFVYTMEDDEKREIAVTLGIKTMVNTEISGNGLYVGMQLIDDPEGLLTNTSDMPFAPMWRDR